MNHRILALAVALTPLTAFFACQGYDFVFQPDNDRLGTHLRFAVEQPSKADILFVIDNSSSMTLKQSALQTAIGYLLNGDPASPQAGGLASEDTSYRIGIVSTDMDGYEEDCLGTLFSDYNPAVPAPAAKGNCDPTKNIVLRRPHDGALGRLLAAYDPKEFDSATLSNPDPRLTAELRSILDTMFPTSVNDGPVSTVTGEKGARSVIDRDVIEKEACQAAGCTNCQKGDACFDQKATVIATQLVMSYFRANVSGLGISGSGWESGIQTSLMAVGVDPTLSDEAAIVPGNDLTLPGQPNSYTGIDSTTGQLVNDSWTRKEALLAIMYVSDEQDCSMPSSLRSSTELYEELSGYPAGSLCYQPLMANSLLGVNRMAKLLNDKRRLLAGAARLAVGFIGGLRQNGPAGRASREGTISDCVLTSRAAAGADGTPSADCSCFNGAVDEFGAPDLRWCEFTQIQSADGGGRLGCDGFAGSRYLNFANQFRRRAFDSVCKAQGNGYGPVLQDFAKVATVACFDLQGVRPANNDPSYITVKRVSRVEAQAGVQPKDLTRTGPDSPEQGWYFDDAEQKVCLTALDRLIGDVYDIFILTQDKLDFTR